MQNKTFIERIQFSCQLSFLESSIVIFDYVLLEDLNHVMGDQYRVRQLRAIARMSLDTILRTPENFTEFADEELMSELDYVISEYTNDRVDLLVVLLLLVENITGQDDEVLEDPIKVGVLRIAKGLLETNYDLQVNLDAFSIAA